MRPACPVCFGDGAIVPSGVEPDACPRCTALAEVEWRAAHEPHLPYPAPQPAIGAEIIPMARVRAGIRRVA